MEETLWGLLVKEELQFYYVFKIPSDEIRPCRLLCFLLYLNKEFWLSGRYSGMFADSDCVASNLVLLFIGPAKAPVPCCTYGHYCFLQGS